VHVLLAALLTLSPVALPADAAADSVPAATSEVTVMPLGASMTFGKGSSSGNGYREELRLSLAAAGIDVDYLGSLKSGTMADPDNEGHGGWRIDQVAAGADGFLSTYKPQVVLLNAGTNDTRQNYKLSEAPARLHALVDQVVADVPDAVVVFSTLQPSGDAAINVKVDQFNAQLPAIARAETAAGHRVYLADLNSAMTVDDIGPDGIHPNDGGYTKIAKVWSDTLLPVLQPAADPATAGPAS
jgi:lysophospholipase L1-like esterase